MVEGDSKGKGQQQKRIYPVDLAIVVLVRGTKSKVDSQLIAYGCASQTFDVRD